MKVDEEFGHDRDHSFLTDDEENQAELACTSEEDHAENSDSSESLSRNQSYPTNSPWPQSYRPSMDMLTGITPPNISFTMGSGVPRASGTLSSVYKRCQSSCVDASSASKPLLSEISLDNEEVPTSTFPATSQIKLSICSLPLPARNQSSFAQSVLNGINVLCGIGLLTTPYAVKEGGWFGLFILFFCGVIACYTGILMKRCLESSPGLQTYPDIGQAAFGLAGRLIISILLYVELYAASVEFIIMMSDNLSRLFPNSYLSISSMSLDSHQIFAIVATIIILPTVWLQDISLLSYLSVGGVLSSILVVLCLLWVGAVDGVGFHPGGRAIDLANLSVAIGIYGFGYSGHSVFPNLYSSMKDRSKFPLVLIISFTFCWFTYTGIAIIGYMMFGDSVESQVTLNMPKQFVASKIAVWTAVVTPMSKYALTITPVVLSLEELLPSTKMRSYGVSILIRTIIVVSTLVVALAIPFFAILMALMGSFLAMIAALIFPCMCYLSIHKGRLNNLQIGICIFIIIVGLVSGCCGTYSALSRLAGNLA